MTDTCRFDGLALNATEPDAAADWYAQHFGGELLDGDGGAVARFRAGRGTADLHWRGAEAPGPSIGTGLDHTGWSVDDLDEVHAALLADGATEFWTPRHFGPARLYISFVTDPWGAKIELLEDKDHPGFHHVHILGPGLRAGPRLAPQPRTRPGRDLQGRPARRPLRNDARPLPSDGR